MFTSAIGQGIGMTANDTGNGANGSAGSPTAPTVNIAAPSPTGVDVSGKSPSGSNTWAITYSGTVTAYNLIASEVSVTTSGTVAGTISIQNGTTATPSVKFTWSSGTGHVQITVLAGACQNSGVNNTQSSLSSACNYYN